MLVADGIDGTDFTLPRGDSVDGFMMTLRIEASDRYGASVSVTTTTMVTGPILPRAYTGTRVHLHTQPNNMYKLIMTFFSGYYLN